MQAIEAGALAGPGGVAPSARADGALDLGDTAPEQAPVAINGRTLQGWVVANRRAPRIVFATIRAAERQLREAIAAGLDPDLAWDQHVSRLLVAVVPGLTYDEAEMVDEDHAYPALTRLGVLKPLAEPGETEAAARTDPPVARPSTGAKRRRGSPASTT